MKKFGIITTVIVGTFLLTALQSCTDHFSEMNTHPSQVSPDVIEPGMLFTQALRSGVYSIPNYSGVAKEFSGTFVSQSSGNIFLQGSYGSPWNMYNGDLIAIADFLRLTADDPWLANYNAIGRIWKVWLFQQVTDNYGDIPYFEAVRAQEESVPDPTYDSQEDIYIDMMEQLKQAVADLEDSPDRGSLDSQDLLYEGDVEMWRRFANSLRLRYALRVRYADPQLAAEQLADVINEPMIEDNSQNAHVMTLPEGTDHDTNRHPLYNQSLTVGNPLACTHTLIYSMREILSEDLDMDDPRLSIYCKPAETDGEFRGNTINRRDGYRWFHHNANISHLGDRLLQPEQPINVMTYAEVQFNKAEAFKAGLVEGDEQVAYEAGLRASLEFYEVDETEIDNFLESSAGTLSGSDDDKLRQISTQRYLSLFQQTAEAWNEHRRTGYPYIYVYAADAGHTNGQVPRRLTYPNSEYQNNNAKLQEAIDRMGGDQLSTRVWWDANENSPVEHPDDAEGLFPPRPDHNVTQEEFTSN